MSCNVIALFAVIVAAGFAGCAAVAIGEESIRAALVTPMAYAETAQAYR